VSCAYRYQPVFQEERLFYHNDVKSVAVLPFLDLAKTPGGGDDVAEIFSSELARFREVNIIHPAAVRQYLAEHQVTLTEANVLEEASAIGAFFNVQAVVVGTVTERNVYYPPICGISIVVLNTEENDVLTSPSVVYDSSFNYVRNELKQYASVKRLTDSLFREDLLLHQFDLYIRFVCHQLILKYL